MTVNAELIEGTMEPVYYYPGEYDWDILYLMRSEATTCIKALDNSNNTLKSPNLKKILTLLLIIVIASVIGGIYGIVHDQFTYSNFSGKYYTKFKFYQFGLMDTGNEAIFPNPRLYVSIVGILATWWMGAIIGSILGLVGLVHKDSKQMFRSLVYGKLYLAGVGVSWPLPENLIDRNNFIAVGSIAQLQLPGWRHRTGSRHLIQPETKTKSGDSFHIENKELDQQENR